MRGYVKNFNKEKGYGFITRSNGKTVFVHQSDIQMDGFRFLDAGDLVEFNTEADSKGIKAVNVIPVFTLGQVKKKAKEKGLQLVAAKDSFGSVGWFIADENDKLVASDYVMDLRQVADYLENL